MTLSRYLKLKPEYRQWIAENVEENPRGFCNMFSHRLQREFPHLRVARGIYRTLAGYGEPHWWTVDVDGTVVDPTAAQFLCKGEGTYEELTQEEIEEQFPCGKCANCGDDIYKADNAPSDMICSAECWSSYAAYCSNPGRY